MFVRPPQQSQQQTEHEIYDLSWLSDAGVDLPGRPTQSSPTQLPELLHLPQVAAPQQPVAPLAAQQALAAPPPTQTAVPENVQQAELASTGSAVVRDGPDGLWVLPGGHDYSGAPMVVGDTSSVMDVSLLEGSGFSVAFTIAWQRLSPGVHAIDLKDKDSGSSILSISSAEDGTALTFMMTRDGTPAVLTVSNAFEANDKARYLCTVGATGKMQVFRDGIILGRLKPDGTYQDNTRGGSTNQAVPDGQLLLGHTTEEQQSSGANIFTGWIGDVCAFSKEVLWGDASTCVQKAAAIAA